MSVVAIVQARLGSSRLPAKVLLDLGGVTALERCIRRVRRFAGVDEVVIATTTAPADDVIVRVASRIGARAFRGSEDDVLSRYLEAARATGASAIVRCTSDCPLLDPELGGLVVRAFLDGQRASRKVDYVSNGIEPGLPRGLDVEMFGRDALERAHRDALDGPEREHVTLRMYRRPEEYRLIGAMPALEADLSHHRWTLDELDDYRMLFHVFEQLGARADEASMHDVLAVLEAHPEIVAMNAHVKQKSV